MGFTAIPGAGADLSGDTFTALITELRPLFAACTADQNLATSSTALQNVTELVIPVAANTSYPFMCIISTSLSAGSAEDIKVGFTFPSGATCHFFGHGMTPGGATSGTTTTDVEVVSRINAASGSTTNNYGSTTSTTNIHIHGVLIVGATAGNLQVQAAQATSGTNTTRVNQGSFLVAWKGA